MRIFKTISIVIGLYVVAFITEAIMAMSDPTYGGGVSIIVILGVLGYASTKVGYRWFDCFFSIIPFYGIFFVFRISYRLAFLPNKDWTDRE